MLERGHHPGLGLEPADELRIVGDAGWNRLDHDLATDRRLHR